MAQITKDDMIRRFGAELIQGNASLFIGAGFSRSSGFVDWKMLLQEIAFDLGLDIARESDLLAVAQYHVNERTSRSRLNQLLIEEFTKDAILSENHKLVASMSIRSIWTTNYDSLLEDAFRAVKKKPDLKTTTANLAQNVPGRDVVIYKMHGDRSQPQEAVLTKEDYELYEDKRGAFSTVLKGELIERTFLFVGFSFTDPNIEYILSRIRGLIGQNQHDHYCIMKWPDAPSDGLPGSRADYDYNRRKLELRIRDLSRYRIHAVMIESYSEITEILSILSRQAHRRDILLSGSAIDYSPLGQPRIEGFLHKLGREIIRRGFTLVSGFGWGIGSAVSYGALDEVYAQELSTDLVRLMPFPKALPSPSARTDFNTRHREAIVSLVGFGIFICGNRFRGEVEMASGVYEEFALLCKAGKYPLPIGASGWTAKTIWNEVTSKPDLYYGEKDVLGELGVLNDEQASDDQYIEAIFDMIKKLS